MIKEIWYQAESNSGKKESWIHNKNKGTDLSVIYVITKNYSYKVNYQILPLGIVYVNINYK